MANFPYPPLENILTLLPIFREITLAHIEKAGDEEITETIHGTGQNLRYFAKTMNLFVHSIDTNDAGELRLWVKRMNE